VKSRELRSRREKGSGEGGGESREGKNLIKAWAIALKRGWRLPYSAGSVNVLRRRGRGGANRFHFGPWRKGKRDVGPSTCSRIPIREKKKEAQRNNDSRGGSDMGEGRPRKNHNNHEEKGENREGGMGNQTKKGIWMGKGQLGARRLRGGVLKEGDKRHVDRCDIQSAAGYVTVKGLKNRRKEKGEEGTVILESRR